MLLPLLGVLGLRGAEGSSARRNSLRVRTRRRTHTELAAVAAAPATAAVMPSELMNVAATVPPPKASGMSHQPYQATGARAAGGGVASSICILRSNTIEQRGVCKGNRTEWDASRDDRW